MIRNTIYAKQSRKGAVVVLTAFLMIGMLGLLAMALDIGYLLVARAELQRTADSAAMAATWELADEGMFKGDPYLSYAVADARSQAVTFVGANPVCSSSPLVDSNTENHICGDVVIGHLANLSDANSALDLADPSRFNAVTVRVRRSASMNGLVPSFFGRALGVNGFVSEAEATAALSSKVGGFRIPRDRCNIAMLPFALDEVTWKRLIRNETDDDWSWNGKGAEITSTSDGIREVNLYPQGTDSPGNRGTVDIGSANNSTNDIARQIVDGISPEDLEFHDGELKFDCHGELELNGDTGISAGVEDELISIKGERRIIPIFRDVVNPGENATYKIVKFAGVRIMEVELNGNMKKKRVIIQPARMIVKGVIPSDVTGTSDLVFTPVQLVR